MESDGNTTGEACYTGPGSSGIRTGSFHLFAQLEIVCHPAEMLSKVDTGLSLAPDYRTVVYRLGERW